MSEPTKSTPVIRHRAIVRLPYTFLRDLLFPPDTKILGIVEDVPTIYQEQGDFLVAIEHPDLPATEPGMSLPCMRPRYARHAPPADEAQGLIWIEFLEWGPPRP